MTHPSLERLESDSSKISTSLFHPPPLVPCLALRRTWSEKKFLPWKKSFLEDGVNYSVTTGLSTARRATGHFQPCFPSSRPVSRPVFGSKVLPYLVDKTISLSTRIPSPIRTGRVRVWNTYFGCHVHVNTLVSRRRRAGGWLARAIPPAARQSHT
jgi:hypothetical protein